MAICVYCGKDRKCTREHVIPSFIYGHIDRKAFPSLSAWNEATKSQIRGEHKVKDVCAECNNQHLSMLDAYGKSFLIQNNLLRPLYETNLVLRYDYHKLARWLLKITFNASRASGESSHESAAYASYILTGDEAPSKKRFFILAELLKPHQHINITDDVSPIVNEQGYSNPFLVRVTRTFLSEELKGSFKVENIGFGGLFFHLCFIGDLVRSASASQLKRKVLQDNHWSYLLDQGTHSVRMRASHRDWMEMRNGQTYRELQILKGVNDPFPVR
ncbi:MAG: HNH endonuclease [Candidatus Thiodiazotropha sp. (ex Monitilora ramsayi)]|nr:HNH endonuclease [Candidatus Thiodiazotropha sp. (ex Monitilora ramsayi)]